MAAGLENVAAYSVVDSVVALIQGRRWWPTTLLLALHRDLVVVIVASHILVVVVVWQLLDVVVPQTHVPYTALVVVAVAVPMSVDPFHCHQDHHYWQTPYRSDDGPQSQLVHISRGKNQSVYFVVMRLPHFPLVPTRPDHSVSTIHLVSVVCNHWDNVGIGSNVPSPHDGYYRPRTAYWRGKCNFRSWFPLPHKRHSGSLLERRVVATTMRPWWPTPPRRPPPASRDPKLQKIPNFDRQVHPSHSTYWIPSIPKSAGIVAADAAVVVVVYDDDCRVVVVAGPVWIRRVSSSSWVVVVVRVGRRKQQPYRVRRTLRRDRLSNTDSDSRVEHPWM